MHRCQTSLCQVIRSIQISMHKRNYLAGGVEERWLVRDIHGWGLIQERSINDTNTVALLQHLEGVCQVGS